MLWTIAVVLVILGLLGLCAGFTVGSFIHIVFAAAVALLVVSLSREAMINQKLRHVLQRRGPKREGNQRRDRLADQPIPPRIMP